MTTVATADSNNLVTLLLSTCNNNIDHGVCYYSCMVTIWQDYLQTTCCKLQHVVLHVFMHAATVYLQLYSNNLARLLTTCYQL